MQVDIYEFEKMEMTSQEEMEKQARQYAEEQRQAAQMELQAMRQAKNAQQAQLVALRQEFEGLRQEAAHRHQQDKEVAQALEHKVAQVGVWGTACITFWLGSRVRVMFTTLHDSKSA